jgi:triosephosphate isomerase
MVSMAGSPSVLVRRPLVLGNWKMNGSRAANAELLAALAGAVFVALAGAVLAALTGAALTGAALVALAGVVLAGAALAALVVAGAG